MADFVLESVVFTIIGLQLPIVVEGLAGRDPYDVAVVAVATSLAVIVARIAWVFPGTYLPRRVSSRIRARGPAPPWQHVAVVAWSGMRGVVSLAAAFALPADFPERSLVLFLTFVVVLTTLGVQGATLPYVIRRLGVTGTDSHTDDLAEAQAKYFAARDALNRLNELVEDAEVDADVVARLRANAEHRSNWAWERLGAKAETPAQAFKRLRREMLITERNVFVQLRDEGRLDDELLRELLRELDLEEAILDRD
jgi:CPA1 family monovalent cation:H+ antiporter